MRIHFDGREVNGKSILDLIRLDAPLGSRLSLSAQGGEDGEGLLQAIRTLFADGFGEMDG